MRFRRRLLILYGAFCLGLVVVWGRTLQMQAFEGDHWGTHALRVRQAHVTLEAPRGRILDAHGVVLARDEAVLQLVVVPDLFDRRTRKRCTACGLVHYDRKWGFRKRCPCRRGHDEPTTLEPLPRQDLGPLERALALRPGELAERAGKRIAEIGRLVAAYERRLDEVPALEAFRDTMVEAYEDDLMSRPAVLETGIPDAAARLVLIDEEGTYRGFRIQTELRRRYPLGDFAPHLLGYPTKVRDEAEYQTLLRRRGDGEVTRNTRVGRRGVERAYDSHLHGRPGGQVLERDHGGSFTIVAEERAPHPGQDLRLTVDAEASRAAERILEDVASRENYYPKGRPSACFVALDAETGALRLWAETPRFDLNADLGVLYDPLFVEKDPDPERREWNPRHDLRDGMDLAMWRERIDAPMSVALSRIAQVAVEPGSTFKAMIGLALLETGHLAGDWHHVCAGRSKPGCRNCGSVNVVSALECSCNKFFAWYVRDSRRSPWQRRRRDVGAFLRHLGIGENPNPEFPEWTSGTWLRPGFDFSLAGLVDEIVAAWQAEIDADRTARRAAGDDAPAPSSAGVPPVPEIDFQVAPSCPDVVGGSPEKIRRLLRDTIRHVQRVSGQPRIRVRASLAERHETQLLIEFDVRAAGAPPWTALPGVVAASLPRGWADAIRDGRMGVRGNPARGGALWFRARYETRLGRTPQSPDPIVHPHDGRNVAIGQGPVLTTPLQMARAVAALANGGHLVTPHVVDEISGRPLGRDRVPLGLAPVNLELVRAGMQGVIDGARGTARHAGWESVPALVYGKTGTAQLGQQWRPWEDDAEAAEVWHHWFVGFLEAPGRAPLAFACVLHARTEGGSGATAAVAAARILAAYLRKARG